MQQSEERIRCLCSRGTFRVRWASNRTQYDHLLHAGTFLARMMHTWKPRQQLLRPAAGR